jgi:hypothetical protein
VANTVLNINQRFPVGQSVDAYLVGEGQARATADREPYGLTSKETAVVAADGTLTFSTLTAKQGYMAYGLVGSDNRYVRFVAV